MTSESTPPQTPLQAASDTNDVRDANESPAGIPEPKRLDAEKAEPRKPRILLLENRRDQAEPWRRIFTLSGYDCEIAGTQERARELLAGETREFDLLVADLGLHRPEDFALAQEIRRMERYRALPIIILTGHNSREARARASALGVAEYLVKPVDAAQLLPVVARWIQPKQA